MKTLFRQIVRNILIFIASKLPRNQIERRQKYPQLWIYSPDRWVELKNQYHEDGRPKVRLSRLRILVCWMCGIITGHEISKTEFGYGGDGFIDRNCRWCGERIKIPIKENILGRNMSDLVDYLDNENKKL